MDLKKTEDSLRRIKNIKRQLDEINGNEIIELRVYTKGSWSNIDFKPKSKAILNMVVHQIKMELQADLKQEMFNIKTAIEE